MLCLNQKPKNSTTYINPLPRSITSIDTTEQNLESTFDNTYQKIDFENLVVIISQMITDGVRHSCHYSL